ncbi:MAG: TlyA family RNA methyltransferase [Dehalococcoidia bacterium]|nr:TlyA family RNA methyltransferase [Dehalococcoidia bacterium]
MGKQRLDTLLVDRGLVESPEKARAMVMAGQVRVGERPAAKPGMLVDASAPLQVAASPRYVSRGGEKLEHALRAFRLDVRGLVAADIGASTGGFTDCLLQHGARRVYAIDVGKGLLDYALRRDPRVAVMEDVNVRHLDGLPERVDIVTVDVAFISLRLVLPVAAMLFDGARRGVATTQATIGHRESGSGGCCAPTSRDSGGCYAPTSARGAIIALFKPQFEAHKPEVPRGGVIRDPRLHATLIGRFVAWCVANGLRVLDLTASPILGAAGNREFLFWLTPAEGPDAGAGKPRLRDGLAPVGAAERKTNRARVGAGFKPAPTGRRTAGQAP